jgi:hypothetical protein
MLYREMVAVYSEIHTKHINVELLNVKHEGTWSDHWAVRN